MPEVNPLAIFAATVAAFVAGGAYYAALGQQLAQVSDAAAAGGQMPAWKMAVELVRCLVLATAVAGLVSLIGSGGLAHGLLLGLALWVGFPLVLWIGAVIHENAPWKLAVIHAGDWLVKLLLIGTIVSVWQ
jgi:Protein of unknown function (DUF1761)